MSFFSRLFGRGGDTRHQGVQDPSPSGGGSTAAPVTFDSAMQVSACWASVRLLTEAVSSMPLKCYDVDEASGIKSPNTSYELWRLLNRRPNRYQTRTEFFEQVMLNLTCWGNSYCAVERDNNGNIFSLLPLPASQTEPYLLPDGAVSYRFTDANSNVKIYAEQSIWHIKLFGNGLIGLSPLGYARKSLGVAIALDNRMTKLMSNGGKATGVLMVDKALSPQQREAVRNNFKELEEGNSDRLFVLEAGMKYEQTSLSPSDMQMIENRRFQTEDIARFFGVPSVLINDTSGTTAWGSGIDQINMGFYKLNLRPYLERIESSLKRWLMPSSDWESIEIEFDFDNLLRADQATRLDGYSKAINSGQMTPNEARAKEGRKNLTGGNAIYLNGTLVPAGTNRNEGEPSGNEI